MWKGRKFIPANLLSLIVQSVEGRAKVQNGGWNGEWGDESAKVGPLAFGTL
jgi:hypothetical protein